jgi:hypothetical protein
VVTELRQHNELGLAARRFVQPVQALGKVGIHIRTYMKLGCRHPNNRGISHGMKSAVL